MDGFYTIAEFLRIHSIGRTTLYRAVQAGQIRITKLGRSSRVAKTDAAAWVASLPTIGGGT